MLIQDSPTPHVKLLEAPLWNEWIPAASKGQITADAAPYDQVGIPDDAVLRLLKLGAFDFASFDIAKVAGDDPKFEGCDLSGLTLTFEDARKGCEAWRATVDKLMQQKWNAKLLAIGTAPPQAIWCATEVKGFDDLKGKKLRVYTKTMVDFAQGIGAAPVNIAFREVVTALQNKVVDCAVTGTAVGNVAGWIEVTKYLMPISLGWAINVHVVNLTTWKRLDPKVQAFLEAEYKKFEDKFWQTMKDLDADAANCNVGKQPCRNGKLANMIMVPVADADQAALQEADAGNRAQGLAQARRRRRRQGMERRPSARRSAWRRRSSRELLPGDELADGGVHQRGLLVHDPVRAVRHAGW